MPRKKKNEEQMEEVVLTTENSAHSTDAPETTIFDEIKNLPAGAYDDIEPELPSKTKRTFRSRIGRYASDALAARNSGSTLDGEKAKPEKVGQRKRGRPKSDNPYSVVFTLRMRPTMAEICRDKGGSSFVRELVEQHLTREKPVRCANNAQVEPRSIDPSTLRPEDYGQIFAPSHKAIRLKKKYSSFADPKDEGQGEIELSAWLGEQLGSSFVVEAKGDALRDIGIMEGDMLVFDRDAAPRAGSIVIAVGDDFVTVKRLRIIDGRPELHAENRAARYKPITDPFIVKGVLKGVCRKVI